MKKTFEIILALGILILGSGIFLYYAHKDKAANNDGPQRTENYYLSLDNKADFQAIQGVPLSDKFNNVWSIKLVYDTDNDRLYYVHSGKFRYHYNFCSEVLGYHEPLEVFNMLNYGSSFGRRFYLANLNLYPHSGICALEFTSDDRIDARQIATLFKAVQNTSFLGDSLRLLISSDYLGSLDQQHKIALPKVYPTEIYNNQQYQMLHEGQSLGILRKVADMRELYTSIQAGDIVITKGTPVNVPLCAGIITDMYQTPLSHINVLCHNRDIPSAADRRIWQDKSLDTLEGKIVCLSVSDEGLKIRPASMEELSGYRNSRPPVARTVLQGDLETRKLLSARDFGMRQKHTVGNKAAGLGELYKLSHRYNNKFETPEGAFAIPFYFYKQHVDRPEIKTAIDQLLSDDRFRKDTRALQSQLKLIRKKIREAPVDPALLAMVSDMIRQSNIGNSYRFRSSSNAEDREGFSGAGLYDSKTGILGDTSKPVDKAIRAVWASAWNDVAYMEREAYNIDQSGVLMGILVHRNFPDEKSNGVAITRNLYRYDFPGMTVNVQIGEVEVVSPPDSVTCEQFVCVPVSETKMFSDEIAVDYITYSNISGGKKVLTKQQITKLYYALDQIKNYFYGMLDFNQKPAFQQYALDIEFKFDKNDKLYIKQVRPYF